MQEVPNALEQALTVAKGAAEEHAEADKIMEMRERRKRAEKRKIEREKRQKEQEELESGSLEEDAIDRCGQDLLSQAAWSCSGTGWNSGLRGCGGLQERIMRCAKAKNESLA